ncbi:MAG: hypothetical protein ACYCZO_10835 [Daejeonella sp.]
MLHQFTWQQFLIAALILTLVWYIAIILLYYRTKILDLFSKKSKHKQPEKLKREWEEELEEDDNDDLIGRQAVPEGVSEVEMHMFGFAPIIKKETNPEHDKDTQLGLVPDVLEELKGIFRILEKENGSKEDFISLFKLVSSKYPKVKGTSNQQALNEHIRENLPFHISDEELANLWN